MYNEKLVAVIKVNGKVLRELGGTVSLPFGSEYSILVKNLNSVRAQVKVSVDGKDATEGTRLVIMPNSSIDLERYIRNGNLQAGNRFKFIERSPEVEAHRGIGEDDGLIRVEAWKELDRPFVPVPHYYDDPLDPYYPWRPHPWRKRFGGGIGGSSTERPSASGMHLNSVRSFSDSCDVQVKSLNANDAGITVPGSESGQQFHKVSNFDVEPQSIVIVLRLRGAVGDELVSRPITVDFKPVCDTCGLTGAATSQYCSRCGAWLKLV